MFSTFVNRSFSTYATAMEDDERQKKLEAGKAKLAEYRQRKAQADGQKKQKKKKKSPGTREGVNAQDGPDHDQSVGEDPTEQSTGRGASANSAEFTISRTLRSGDTIKQDQTYTIEPESEVSTTADDYTSEVNGCSAVLKIKPSSEDVIREEDVHVSETHSEHQAQSSQTRLEMMEDELAGKQRAIEELNRELEVMRSAIGTEGLQQLQDFEAAVKQRDGIITQLTANLQQARKEKDEIMREFLELTEQSQKLQIQFQQLQAGETLRNTSHSSTAADFLQAKQQILKYQQQIEEQKLQLKSYQSKSEEYQLQINLLQERAKEFKTANETLRNTSHSSNAADLLQAKQQILKYQQQIEEQELQLKSYQSKSEEYQLQINLLQDRAKEFETFANEQEGSVSQRLQEKEQLIKQQENTITEHMNTETELKEKLLASDMLLEDLSKERSQDIETLKTELNNSKQRERQSSSEIKQLMGTVEELQKHFHKGNLSESEIIQKMEVDTQQKMDQLRAELDEMYGEQIVQMKQELRKQHMTEMDKLIAQHRSELELRQVHHSGSVANEDQVNLMNMAKNELNVKLQEAQFQKDQVKQELSRQLAKVTEEKSSLQTQVEDLLEDLRFAREKAQRASRSISEQEQKLGEVGNLQATISDLKDQLVAAAESTKELELKHESEVTNYKIKLEMLEREKDAVLDRMAESQEAELERLRTQLLFSHEEEIIKLKEDLQRGSQINIENLKDDLALKYKQKLEGLQKSFNEQLESVKIERDSLVTEKEALIADISKMKEDLNQSLESSKTEEMTLQIKELHTEIKALQKVEEENGALENKIQQLLAKNELLEKQIKKKEDDMDRKIKELEDENGRLNKSREVLKQKLQASNLDSGMSASENSAATCAVGMETQTSNEQLQIERLASENEQLKNEQVQLKEEIKRQRNTFSFAEKNFEVNYQELNDEYTCLLKVKAGLEERIIKERVQYEAKMNSLHTQILQSEKEKLAGSGVLAVETSKVGKTVRDCIDGGEIVEKDTTELMEKLEVAQREKKELSLRLSEVSDKLNLKQNEIEQLKKEMGSLKDEYRQHVGKHKELNVTQETRVKTLEYQSLEYSSGITATEIVDTGSCTLENHYHQIALLEEKVIALQTSLQNATLERNQFQEKEKSLIHEKESLLARLQELKGKAVTESPAVATVQPDRDQLQQQLDTFKTEQLGLAKLMQQKALVEESLHKKLEEKEKALIAAEKEMFNLHERLNKLYQRDCADERFVEKHEEKVECSGIEQDEKDIVDHMNRTQLITENWPEMENKQQLAEAEFRLQMEAQRISLTQIYAAQRELVQEKLQTDKKQCLSLLKEDLTTRHRQEVDRLHKKYQQELKDLKEQKTDESDERMSSQQQIQKLIKLVSEECKQLILSFGSVFGEKELEALHYKEPAEAKRSSDESIAGTKEQTGDPSSLLHEAKELHTELQKLKDKILQEYNSLTGLQTLLKSDSHKLEELQKAYDEFRCSSQEEMTSLRMQIESARASTEDLHDLKEQLKVRSARLEEIEKLKSEFNLQRNQFEDQHTQEIERLRMYYQQQIKETEERYTTEMIILQQRLQDVTGSEAQFSESQFAVQKDNGLEQQCTEEIKVYKEGTSAEALSSAGHLDKEHQEDICHELFHLDEEQIVEPLRHSHKEQQERQSEEQHSLRAQLAQNSSVNDVSVGEERINIENQDTINTSVSGGKGKLPPKMQNSSTQTEQNEGDNKEVPQEASPHPEASAQHAEKPASDDLTVERNILKKVNERLRIVLSEVLKTTAAAEETIGRHVEGLLVASSKGAHYPQRAAWEQAAEDPLKPHIVQGHGAGGDVSSESCQGSDAGGGDANVWSRETDEGLEMSQRLAEGMFTGAELDLENEEFMVNISTRLQAAVEKLLEAITETTNQLEHARITQTELTRKSFRRNAEINELVKRQEELQERLSEETKARELLALELHKAEGILDGYADERVALEEQVKQKAEIQQHLEQELQLTGSHLRELEEEQQIMRQERELLSRQQDAMRDTAGSKELRLVEAAVDAAPEADLLEETEKLMKEKVEVQRQAEKENSELLKQVKKLESELEEEVNRVIEIEQENKAEIMDLRQQIQALEKQLEKNRKFLDEQAIDREHERDVFQQEIQKLEQQLKYPQKLQSSTEQRNKEVEVLINQLKDKTDGCSELVLGKEQLQRDVQERNEEIEKLENRIRELEQALISSSDRLQKVEERKHYTPVVFKGEITLEAQLQTEREALDRKEKEISNLEEQLEQFREELENKNEEVQQLHMQMEIQRKELSTQHQELNHQNTMLKHQVEDLQKSLNDSDDVSIEDHRIVIGKFSQVMQEKDKEIEHLNEQLHICQQQLEFASDNKVIEEKNEQMRELESQIECLKSEQERLKRKSEDEIEQLNEVIETLQQELAKIEHKTQDDDPEEPSSLKHPLEMMVEEKEAPMLQEKSCKEVSLTKEEFEGMKVKIQQTNQELETLKADHLRLLQKYKCLQEEGSVISVEKISNTTAELEEALREKTTTVLVIQAEIKALEESANVKITTLEAKQEELEAFVREKNAELDLCHSQEVQAQAKTELLKQKIIELEDELREKVAAALVSQAQLGAVQEQSKVHTKELHSQIKELQGHSVTGVGLRETAEVAETVAEAIAVTHGFTELDNEKQDRKTEDHPKNKLSVLTLKLTELEKELAELQKDRELQRQLVHSTEEGVVEYEKKLAQLLARLDQMKKPIAEKQDVQTSKARTTKPKIDKTVSASEMALELEQVKSEAAATKEELNSYRERAEKLKDELQVRELTITQLQENLQQATKTKPEMDEPTAASKLASGQKEAKSEAAATQEELNSYEERARKHKDELQATKSKLESDEPAAVSKLVLEVEEGKSEAAIAKEELNSYSMQAEKLKDELQAPKSKLESDEPTAVSELVLELEEVKSEAPSMNEELNSYKEQTEKLKDLLQVRELAITQLQEDLQQAKESKLERDEPADVSKLVLELEAVKSEAASMKEELNSYRKCAEKHKDELQERELTIANLQDDLQQATKHIPQSNEPAAISKLVLELEQVNSEAAVTKEELNSYRECAEKLKEGLQMRDLTIAQLQEDLKQVKEALAKAEEALGHHHQKKDTKLFEGKPDIVCDKTKHTSTKEKPSLVRKNSASQTDKPANVDRSFQTPNVLCKDAEIQIDLIKQNSSSSEQLTEVIRQYKEKIGQMQELHAAEIMDMETRHICESDTLKSDSQILREQCKALNAFLEKMRATGGIPASVLEQPGSSQFRDGYTSDSSSDWSQRMYYDISTQNQEYRITPEEARRDNEMPQTSSEVLPDKIKYLLREVLQEGIQVLSLSEVPCIEGKMGTSEQYSECWQKEKQALLATVESLRVLITKMQVHRDTEISLNFASAEGVADWRGELLQAIQQVFLKERSVLKSALETHMASLETSDIFVHLNQLENRLREQDARNRDAMEILQDADRNSLLMEIGQLQAQLQRAQQGDSRGDRASAQLALQTSSDGHQDYTLQDNQASVVELEVNRVKESGNELKDRFHSEKMVIAELKNELAQTKLELETTLKAQHKHLKELEALRTEVSEKTAEMDMLNDALANEQKKSRELQWAFENEKCKSERKQEREKEEFEDLKFTLEDQKRKNCQISTLLEQERQAAANLKQQTETEKTLHQAQLSHELSRISELQVLLDSEKARALELNSALEQEKELRSQLNLSPQRRLEAGDSTADAGCSQMEDGVRTMKELLGDLQGQLDEKHTRIVQLLEDMERHKLEVVQVRQQLDEERQLHRKALQKEQEAYRLVQDKLEQLQLKDEDLQRLLDRERQLVVRLQQERERLQESVSELQDQENQRENADQPDPQTSLCRADIPVDRTRDWVLQQKISDVLTVGSSGHSLNEANGGIAAPADIKHLDGIIQRLQLIASKLKTLASKASSRIPFEAADDENLIWLQNSIQDIVSQLQQLPAIRPKVEQSVLLPTGSSSSSSLTERLLRQNAELTGFVSRLTEEKNDLRNSLIKLEEEVRRFRQRGLGGLHYSNRKPLDNQDTIDVLTSDQETWSREKDNLEKSLHQAETEVNKLRAELRSDALYRDMTGSDVDNVTLKRIYGKYLRAESFRKALIYQKKYLLLLLGGFQECEEATLSLIAKMGGRPSHNLEIITHRCRGFTRFRSAVRVTIAISRMKFLVRRWQRAAGSGSSPSSSINRNGFGQITGNEARTGSPFHPGGVEAYRDRRTSSRARSGLESPRSALSLQQKYQPAESSAGSLACSHLQNYDPDRALTDYIHRLDALQRRLGSVQSGSTSRR
ncbi:A-kinase anchor protein 9-like isoform X7 [Acipenser ruthenus]|uniref:A-kinase anchor protein 9-like isoform X7 n=1 Tax=Acipenser ruthenus TaxID=7906 RepID=UPI002742505B|nr:A-kinase anchor protein 9-like isoform X7 [Acipenser ruthenus]